MDEAKSAFVVLTTVIRFPSERIELDKEFVVSGESEPCLRATKAIALSRVVGVDDAGGMLQYLCREG